MHICTHAQIFISSNDSLIENYNKIFLNWKSLSAINKFPGLRYIIFSLVFAHLENNSRSIL